MPSGHVVQRTVVQMNYSILTLHFCSSAQNHCKTYNVKSRSSGQHASCHGIPASLSQCTILLANVDIHPLRRCNRQCPSHYFKALKSQFTEEMKWPHSHCTVQPLASCKIIFLLILCNWFYCASSIKSIPE